MWAKGESSGNYLEVTGMLPDCDRDCLLVMVKPAGPACHTGSRSCFAPEPLKEQDAGKAEKAAAEDPARIPGGSTLFLEKLESVLLERKSADPEKSYTARLIQSGPARIAKKLGEEAVEVVLEAERGPAERLVSEAADLLYHLDVLLISRQLGWKDVMHALEERHG